MKKPDFLHVTTDSWKLEVAGKILGWAWSKMSVATLFQVFKIRCMSKWNEWSKLIFGLLIQIYES